MQTAKRTDIESCKRNLGHCGGPMGSQVGMSGCRVRPLMQNFHSTPIGTATACHDERLYSCKCLLSNIKIQRTGPKILSNRNRFCPPLNLSVRPHKHSLLPVA